MDSNPLVRVRYAGRTNPFHRDQGKRPLIMPVAIIVLLLLAFSVLFAETDNKQQLMVDIGMPFVGLLVMFLGGYVGAAYIARRVSLVLDSNGIRFNNPVPLASLVKPSWFVSWSALQRVEYKGSLKPGTAKPWLRQIRLHARSGSVRRLDPTRWVDGNRDRPDFGLRMKDLRYSMSTAGAVQMRYRMALQSHLVEDLAACGWPAFDSGPLQTSVRPGYTDEGRFDLMQHRGLKVLTFAALGFLAYFLVDYFFVSPWRYAEGPSVLVFVFTSVVLMAACAGLGKGAPRLEHLVVTLLFGVSVGAACWPAALRLNAMGAQSFVVTYQSVAPGEFEAADGSHPRLTFKGFEEYWADSGQRGSYDFELLHGHLGFWQYNHRRIMGEMREFFSDEKEAVR